MDLDDVGDVQHADRGHEVIAAQLLRRAFAVPALEQLTERFGDVLTEPEPIRELGGGVTVGGEAARDDVAGQDLEQQPEAPQR